MKQTPDYWAWFCAPHNLTLDLQFARNSIRHPGHCAYTKGRKTDVCKSFIRLHVSSNNFRMTVQPGQLECNSPSGKLILTGRIQLQTFKFPFSLAIEVHRRLKFEQDGVFTCFDLCYRLADARRPYPGLWAAFP